MVSNERLLEALPLDCGLKVIVSVALCPDDKVSGNEAPLNENSGSPTFPDEMVTLEFNALSVVVSDLLAPTMTLPKLSPAGLTESCPAAAPLPESEIGEIVLEASDTSVKLPEALAATLGAKTTSKVKLSPAFNCKGKYIPSRLKPTPVKFARERVTVDPPVFFRVSGWLFEFPG